MRSALHRSLLILALTAGVACSAPGGADGDRVDGASAGGATDDSPTVARLDGEEITRAELDAWIQEDWLEQQLQQMTPAQEHEFRAERLERMIDEQLLEREAREQGVAPEALLSRQADDVEVSDAEVKAFYEANQDRLSSVSLEEIAPRIRDHLSQRQAQDAVQRYLKSLRDGADVEVALQAPRTEVAATGPALGPESAPVTVVEFSDFQCPYCARAAPVVKQLHERYPDSVRIVYRHFPLDSVHPQARPAAEASLCAADQDRFWEYHDVLFENARQLGEADLIRYAEELGLDMADFRTCLKEGRHARQVERDLEAGRRAGVTGTPSFFVNGRMLGGAQPLEAFVRIIESELEGRAATSTSGAGEASPSS